MGKHPNNPRRPRRRATAGAIAALAGAAGLVGLSSVATASTTAPDTVSVTMCHATHSGSNPYAEITTNAGGAYNGHYGPSHQSGDDVIPSFSFNGTTYSENLPDGQNLLDHHCNALGIKKTGDASVAPGGKINYTITITNFGRKTIPVNTIDVADPTAYLTGPLATYLLPGASLDWTAISKDAVPDDSASCGSTVKNTATVGFTRAPTGSSSVLTSSAPMPPASSDWTTDVICPVSLSIMKTSPSLTAIPGDTIPYTITVTNAGKYAIPVSSIGVTDDLDPSAVGPIDPPVSGLLNPGMTLDWTASYAVPMETTLCNTDVTNTATVAFAKTPGYSNADGPISSPFTTHLECPLVVDIGKTATNGPVAPGGTATYDVTVTNTGAWTVPFTAIQVSDPTATTLTNPTDTSDLAPNQSRVWTATKDVPLSTPCDVGTVSNTATVTLGAPQVLAILAANPTAFRVAAAADPTATANTPIVCPVDVNVAKTTGSTTVIPGGSVPYDITVTNPSTFAVPFSSILVTDPGADLITAPADTTNLAPGASRIWTATRSAAADVAACGTAVTNTAQVALANLPAGYSAITPAGGSSTAPGVLIAGGICDAPIVPAALVQTATQASLSVRKLGPVVARPGSSVSYRIRVKNTSAVAATNVVLTDTPPSALVIGAAPTGSTLTGRTLTWKLGNIGAGDSKTVTVMLGLKATAKGTTCNNANATAANATAARGRSCVRVRTAGDPVRVTG